MSLLLDISGFEALFQVNYEPLARTAYRIVKDKDIAEDIVQDVFCRLWEKKDSLNITDSLKSYLFKSTINQSLNYLKKIKNAGVREELFSFETAADVNSTEYTIALKETSGLVETAVGLLPDACRTIFVLSRYENLSYKEIALKLNISVKTVEAQMTKALKHLRKCLLSILILFL